MFNSFVLLFSGWKSSVVVMIYYFFKSWIYHINNDCDELNILIPIYLFFLAAEIYPSTTLGFDSSACISALIACCIVVMQRSKQQPYWRQYS